MIETVQTWLQRPIVLADALAVLIVLALLRFVICSLTSTNRASQAVRRGVLSRMIANLGLSALPFPLTLIGLIIWAGLLLSFITGAFATIHSLASTLFDSIGDTENNDGETLRWKLLTLSAVTGALGAVVALPFTLIRIRQTQRQTDLQDESLFNDKINTAATDLAARRMVTRSVGQDGKEVVLTEWQDDLITRAAAIDRLQGLAEEAMRKGDDFAPAQRIARMLSIYVQELSRDAAHAAKPAPEFESRAQIHTWAETLRPIQRTDMERAVQSLGRINPDDATARKAFDPKNIDLRCCNLQGFDLRDLNFQGIQLKEAQMQGADLSEARMQGAVLVEAQLQEAHLIEAKMQGASLFKAQLQGACLIDAKMQGADLFGAKMQGASLFRARMQGANLRGTTMSADTDLTTSTLSGAAVSYVDDKTFAKLQAHDDWEQIFRREDFDNLVDFHENWRAFAAALDPPVTIAHDYNRTD